MSAEKMEVRTLPFSSDSTYDTISYKLMETRKSKSKQKPIN